MLSSDLAERTSLNWPSRACEQTASTNTLQTVGVSCLSSREHHCTAVLMVRYMKVFEKIVAQH